MIVTDDIELCLESVGNKVGVLGGRLIHEEYCEEAVASTSISLFLVGWDFKAQLHLRGECCYQRRC